ncbi:hypothetical protein [Mycolicibacterium chlorophenolicum]|uniref:Nucleoid-associated protein YbaB n=1 Tax=Mycolicibacterium chlorophenolicum TaxID=37916 RepID=A0A0J6VHN0_9MYCO|nr:hypothetical protein [Mycolicibacterium chlorophenolicum]KMO69784.1 hypothetical protein MCHLDSM_05896 [Mycolicibacterium chlorophenolicum]
MTGPAQHPSGASPNPKPDHAANFDNLGDAEKVKFVRNETAGALAHLDKLLRDLDDIGAGIDDPDGLVSLSLGFDGHLIEIHIADAIGQVMTNIDLENRLNGLFAAGTEGITEMREEFWKHAAEDSE